MPLSHISKVFAVTDAKIFKLLTDPSGGSATYGDAIDVPGIKSVTIGGEVSSVALRGDNTLLDSDSSLTAVTLTFEYAKLSLDAQAVFLGSTITDAGTTPNQTSTLELTNSDVFNYFKFEAKSASADTIGGDVHFVIHKAKLSAFPETGLAEEDYRTFSVEATAVPLLSSGKWVTTRFNETAAAIS